MKWKLRIRPLTLRVSHDIVFAFKAQRFMFRPVWKRGVVQGGNLIIKLMEKRLGALTFEGCRSNRFVAGSLHEN